MQAAFYQSESDQPHPGRARAIIKAHPEVRQLMVRNPWTALVALSIVVLQTSLAFCFGKLGFGYWWLSLVIAYCVGAFANHANYVIIHDATHNLIFRNKSWNKLVGILVDALSVFPADAAAASESNHHVGPMVLRKLCLRRRLRCGRGLFLWLAGVPLPRVFVFLLHRAAPGRRTLDSGTLHERS